MTRVRIAGAIAALAVTLAGCGDSADDQARDSGREAGRACAWPTRRPRT